MRRHTVLHVVEHWVRPSETFVHDLVRSTTATRAVVAAQRRVPGSAAGSWVGTQNAIGNLSGIFGPILTGVIVDAAGYTTAFIVTAVVAAAGAIWWIVGVPRIQQVALD